mgnify:CR=1 FL=1
MEVSVLQTWNQRSSIILLKIPFYMPLNHKIIVQKSSLHSIGVFAQESIRAWETIEICPIIILNSQDTKIIDQTHLYNYYFSWEDQWSALALGYGSLYNHSYLPNARYQKDFETDRKSVV